MHRFRKLKFKLDQRQVVIDRQTKPTVEAATVYTQHRHLLLLLLLSPKSDTHFAIPRKVKAESQAARLQTAITQCWINLVAGVAYVRAPLFKGPALRRLTGKGGHF